MDFKDILILKKLNIISIGIIIFVFLIAIFTDLFIFKNDINIFIITLGNIRSYIYIGFIYFLICLIVKIMEQNKYCNLFNTLNNEELEVLKSFVISNSCIAEIKNNISIINKLSDIGIVIYNIGELYEGNTRTENGKVYSDIMSKVKLKDEYLLEYIKYYFKFIIKK